MAEFLISNHTVLTLEESETVLGLLSTQVGVTESDSHLWKLQEPQIRYLRKLRLQYVKDIIDIRLQFMKGSQVTDEAAIQIQQCHIHIQLIDYLIQVAQSNGAKS